nr:retrovirus-related Pol polyprotein from transposon TNT 1-94 [Tanacetum cinerariifolium]
MRTRSRSRHKIAEPLWIEFHSQEDQFQEDPPEVPMADNQTMAQLLQAPTVGYEDAIVIPEIAATNFELKHGLINLDGPFQPKTIDGDVKPESQWASDERRVVFQDQRLKSIIMSCLPDDIIELVISCVSAKEIWTDLVHSFKGPLDTKENKIMNLKLKYQTFRAKSTKSLLQTYTRYTTLLNELANDDVNLSKHEINVGFVNSIPEKWLTFSQGLRNANHTQTLDLNKGLVAETFDWDEEEVSDEEEVTQVKVLMALANDELTVGKIHARNNEWVDITIRKGASPSSEVMSLTFQPHSPKDKPGLGHNRVIQIRGGVLAESSQSNESSISVKCNTCRRTIHSTIDHNKFDHFKRGTIFNANKEIVLIAPKRNDVYVLTCQHCLQMEPASLPKPQIVINLSQRVKKERTIELHSKLNKTSLSGSVCIFFIWMYLDQKKSQAPETTMSFIRMLERKNKTLIDAPRTMTNDSVLSKHFWTEAVRIACYTLNRSIIIKRHDKTPYEIFRERIPDINYFHVFGCPVFIYNHKDHLGKFDAKADDGYFLGYSFVSKDFRVFNIRRQQVEETYHVTFDEMIAPNEPDIPHTKDTKGPPDLINTKGTHEQNVQNDQMITQPTDIPSRNNTEVLGSITESLVPDVTQSHISKQAFTSSQPIPQDRWSRDQHIELVNIISDLGEGMLTRSMATKHTAALTSPPGFESSEFPDYVCKLDKALYGLKQAPRSWYETLSTFLIQNKFTKGRIDNTLFIYKSEGDVLFIQVYVDDIIFGLTSYKLCKQFEKLMTKKFEMSSDLKGYSDSDYVGCNMDRKSTLAKPKKGKSQTVTPTLPKSHDPEVPGALFKKRKRPKSKRPPTETKFTPPKPTKGGPDQSTRLRYQSLPKNKGKPSHKGELDTQPIVLSTYAYVRAFLLSDDESEEYIIGAGEEMDEEPQKYDNTLPLTKRQLVMYLRKVLNAVFTKITEDNWEKHEEPYALKQDEELAACAKSSTNMAWNLGSRLLASRIDKGEGIATVSEEDSLKKLVHGSTIVRPDPDALIPYTINEEEEAEKIGLDPKKITSAKAGEKFKKAQDAEH